MTSDPTLPDEPVVWHYTNGAGLVAIVQSHTLWATSASFLNDRQEIELGGQLLAHQLADYAHDAFGVGISDLIRDKTRDGIGPAASRFFILSASSLWDSLAMWRLYGGQQESYAIGLDARSPLAVLAEGAPVEPSYGRTLLLRHQIWTPVAYDVEEQRDLAASASRGLVTQLQALRESGVTFDELRSGATDSERAPQGLSSSQWEELLEDVQHALLLIKHTGFRDERELRYAVVLAAEPESQAELLVSRAMRYRATPYGIAPYLRLTGRRELSSGITDAPERLPIRALAISPSPNGDPTVESAGRLLHDSGYRDVPIVRSSIPFRG